MRSWAEWSLLQSLLSQSILMKETEYFANQSSRSGKGDRVLEEEVDLAGEEAGKTVDHLAEDRNSELQYC